jgi:NodT family efflux transporter outer membrane factor (OMF) lipoprotein
MMKIHPTPIRAAALACLLAASLAGCSSLSHSEYARPALETPVKWQQAPDGVLESVAISGQWWKSFNDPALNSLIDEVLRNNNDLAAAGLLVRRAWLKAGLAADQQRPTLAASIDASRARIKDGDATATRSSSATLTLSYEADLWGRLASVHDSAEWEAKATEQDLASTAWALTATSAKLYWQIAYLNQRVDLATQNIAYARRTLAIINAKHTAGAVSGIELWEALQTLASQQADLTDLIEQRVEARNALAILLNAPPGKTLTVAAYLPQSSLPNVAAGLPAELLGRRPDLRAAELRLRETLADGDATKAGYYPKLALTGSLGSGSSALLNVLSNPVATLGAGLTLPFLQWNEMTLSNKVAQLDYEKAVINFRQTLYAAMADVENALSARSQYQAKASRLELSLTAASGAEKLQAVRYASGAIALKVLLDAEQTRREAEIALVQNRYNILTNQVTLYQTLGGNVADAPVAAPGQEPGQLPGQTSGQALGLASQ